MDDLVINQRLTIPAACLRMRTSTASGPGGQRLNRVQTRVTLQLDLETAAGVLGPRRLEMIQRRLGRRLTTEQELRVICGRHRQQSRNLAEARERLASLVAEALRPVKVRRATKPSKASQKRRVEAKQRRGQRKQERAKRWD